MTTAKRTAAILMAWGLATAGGCGRAAAAAPPEDPLGSSQWVYIARQYFAAAPVVFDPRVRVRAPTAAENSRAVPVRIDAPALKHVRRVRVIVDQATVTTRVLDFYPPEARPALAFSLKIDRATPVRAALQTADGVWHVGGAWIDAVGGGCSVPIAARSVGESASIHARRWPAAAGGTRLKIGLTHAMDSGLIADRPRRFIRDVRVEDTRGRVLARIRPTVNVAANPVFTLDLRVRVRGPLRVVARDNQGQRFVTVLAGAGA